MGVVVTMHGDFNRASRPSPEGLGRLADVINAESRPRVETWAVPRVAVVSGRRFLADHSGID